MRSVSNPLAAWELFAEGGSPLKRYIIATLTAFWIVSLPVLFLLYRSLEPSPDQSIFDYIAWLASQGVLPYVGSFEVNWPGAVLVHIAAQSLFGSTDTAFRSLDFLLMQGAAIAGAAMLWRAHFRVAPAVFLALFPILYVTSGVWMAGQRDMIAGSVLLAACLCLTSHERRFPIAALAGALIIFAVALRPTMLAFLGGAVVLEFARARLPVSDRPAPGAPLALLAGAAAIAVLLLGTGAATGTLAGWYRDAVQFAIGCYAAQDASFPLIDSVSSILRSWHWIAVFAGGGVLAWAARGDVDRYPLLLCLGAIATCIVSFVGQNKGFGYHLSGTLIFLVVLASVFIDTLVCAVFDGQPRRLWRWPWTIGWRPLWFVALGVSVLIAAAGTAQKLRNTTTATAISDSSPMPVALRGLLAEECEAAPVAQKLADLLRGAVPAGGRVLPFNCGYRGAFLAKRLPSSRFGTSTALDGAQRRCPIGFEFERAFAEDLRSRKPDVIIARADETNISTAGAPPPKRKEWATELVEREVRTNYTQIARFGEAIVYQRRP